MCKVKKCMFKSVIYTIGIISLVILVKTSRRYPDLWEKIGKLFDSLFVSTNEQVNKIFSTFRHVKPDITPDQ
jgi:hypothetical protein